MLGFIFNEAMRDLRRAGRVGVSAILLIALSLTALGGFWLLSLNLGRAIAQWGDRVRVIVYLKDEPPAAAPRGAAAADRGGGRRPAPALRLQGRGAARAQALARQPGRRGRAAPAQPAARLRRGDPRRGDRPRRRARARWCAALVRAARGGGGAGRQPVGRRPRPVPAPLPGRGPRRRRGARAGRHPDRDHRHHPGAAPPSRRDGDHAARRRRPRASSAGRACSRAWPRGWSPSIVALATLELAYAVAVPRLEPLLPVTIGLERVAFLSPWQALALIGAGTMLGAMGGLLARGRAHA